jgi:hypothetical protein
MAKSAHRRVLLLAFAIGFTACDGRSPSGPTPLPPAAPSVTAISPSTGSTARPTPVTISGTGFLAGATVTVDAIALSVTALNSTTHAAGPVDVVVTNPGGSGGTLRTAFTYNLEGPFTLTSSADAVDAGGEMRVSWTAPGARAGDWLAVFRVGGSYDDDWWGGTGGATSGSHTLKAPTRPGLYEFRYLVDDSFVDVARSSPVTVR